MSTNNSGELEIEKLTKTLVSKHKKVVALHGVSEQNTYKVFNDLINLMDVEIPDWSSVSTASEEQCISDIKNFLLANVSIKNFKNLPGDGFLLNWWKKRRLKTIMGKLDELETIHQNKENNVRTKSIFLPILTAFSALGTTIAIPLISVTLLRIEPIIEVWGISAFQAIMGFCFTLILMVIFSIFVTLINNVKNNKRDYILVNTAKTLMDIYNNYFTNSMSNAYEEKTTIFGRFFERSKLVINNNYVFFYDSIDTVNSKYTNILKYFKVMNDMDNTVVFDASSFIYIDERKIFQNVFDNDKTELSVFSRYKTKSNGRRLMNFIFYQLSLIANINSKRLLANSPTFVNVLYKFLDYSKTNQELISLLLDIKNHCEKREMTTDNESQQYFVDFFSLLVFKALDETGFEHLLNDLSIYGRPCGVKNNENYIALKIDQILNNNVNTYKQASFVFNLQDFFIDRSSTSKNIYSDLTKLNKSITFSVDKQLDSITNSLRGKGFNVANDEGEQLGNHWYNKKYVSTSEEIIYVKVLELNEEKTYVDELNKILEQALVNHVKNLIIIAYNIKIIFRNINNAFEIVNEILL
ncbi:hypothetical protein [Ureaplasma canigenitalium]|uniref:hypothetical protein n=1 Tax=Ureaplasma canigenitalium TaxID=42092 RepID=UPI0004E1D5F3|nr:hypothetical protein [Ureaplasma canigenitalium]